MLFGALGNVSQAQNIANQDITVVFTKFSTDTEISQTVEKVKQKGGILEITHCQRKRNGKIRFMAGNILFPNGNSGSFRGRKVVLKAQGLTAQIKVG